MDKGMNVNYEYLIVKPIPIEDKRRAAFQVIDSIPSADVIPVTHGQWIFDSDTMTLTCSECGDVFRFDDIDEVLDFKEYALYCIHCGSKMDKEKIDE